MTRHRPLLALVTALCLAATPVTAEDVVNIYNWADYFGETTLDDFQAETGITVNYDTFDSNEMLEAKILAGGSGYDVIYPAMQPFFERMVAAGFLAPLDPTLIPNLDNLDPALMEIIATVDPGNRHGAIFQWGTSGIAYNADMVAERMPDAPVDSFALLFEPDILETFADCGISFIDSPTDVFPVIIHYLGGDPNAFSDSDLEAATERLLALRPHIRKFHNTQLIDDLANGEICLALGWSTDVAQAAYRVEEAGIERDLRFVIPSEGTMVWFDMMAIPADAPNPAAAHAFINFLLRPETMAGIGNLVGQANAVPASIPLIDEAITSDPNIFPPPAVMERLFIGHTPDQAYERQRSRAWTRVRSAR